MIKEQRNSGLELLKIFAMFMIVTLHVITNLSPAKETIVPILNTIDYSIATTNISDFILGTLTILTRAGNAIFIICSCWYLLESNKVKKEKIVKLVSLNFIISIIFLIVTMGLGYSVPKTNILSSMLPTLFDTKWFVTSYILFYMIHGYLNIIIEKCSKKRHFEICLFIIIFYFILNVLSSFLYFTRITIFISYYFIISYMKKYCKDFCNSTSKNVILVLIGILEVIAISLVVNYLGLEISMFNDKRVLIAGDTRLYSLFIGIGLFNLFNKIKFNSKFINNISSLTLLIYIIHENDFMQRVYRPIIWNFIYKVTEYKYILGSTFLFAVALFIVSTLVAYLFNKIFNNPLNRVSIKTLNLTKKVIDKIYEKIS